MNITRDYGCCLNTLFSEFSGRRYEIMGYVYWDDLLIYSDEVDDQIEYVIITREMYRLCGVPSGGFCNGVGT